MKRLESIQEQRKIIEYLKAEGNFGGKKAKTIDRILSEEEQLEKFKVAKKCKTPGN